MNHWVLKSVSEHEMSYKGNDGYPDEINTKYVYDSNVANHLQIQKGDIALLVDKMAVLGLAKISRILIYNSTKQIRRCPICSSTNYEERKNKTPKYRCNRKHEFDVLASSEIEVIRYEAFYTHNFIKPSNYITIDRIRPFFESGYNRNMSMQRLSPNFFRNYLIDEYNALLNEVLYPEADDSDNLLHQIFDDNFAPNDYDERSKIYRSIIERRGQKKFRDAVREMYGNKCVITGCEIVELLEAAHIVPYRGEKDNHPSNGLLLRADIHTLFDLDLIGIEPNKLKVYVKDAVKKDGYEDLQDKRLITQSKFPSKESLNIRWNKFIESK